MEERMTLTPRDIEDRFEEAAYTLRRLPEKDRPRGYGGSWPPVVQEAKHAYRMEAVRDWLREQEARKAGVSRAVAGRR
jgi:hypothetical protein